MGHFSLEIFNATLDCFCSRPFGTLVDSMLRNLDVRAARNGAWRRTGKSRRHLPQKCSFPLSDLILAPTRVHISNGISIDSAAFARLTVVTDRKTERQTTLLRLYSIGRSSRTYL